MGSLRTLFAAIVATLVVSSGTLFAEANKSPVGMVLSLKGKATIISPDGTKRPARLKEPVFVGDRIETEFQSFVQVNFLDRSKVSLAGSSDFTVKDYHYNKEKQEARSELSVENGAMKFMAGKIAKIAPQNYKIHTTTATIGIRGSSGELVTSNGKLPGVPKGLQLMKSGGKGIMATLPGAARPLPDITSSGKGLMIDNGGKVTQNVTFSGSLVKHYAKTTEKKVAQGKSEAKKNQSADKGAKKGEKKATTEKKSEKKPAAKQEKKESKKEPTASKQEKKEEHTAEKEEKSEKQESKERKPVAEKKRQERRENRTASRGAQQPQEKKPAPEQAQHEPAPMDKGPAPMPEKADAPPPPMQERQIAGVAAFQGGHESREMQTPPLMETTSIEPPPPMDMPVAPIHMPEPPPMPVINIEILQEVAATLLEIAQESVEDQAELEKIEAYIEEQLAIKTEELLAEEERLQDEATASTTTTTTTTEAPAITWELFSGHTTGLLEEAAAVRSIFAEVGVEVGSDGQVILSNHNLNLLLPFSADHFSTNTTDPYQPSDGSLKMDANREFGTLSIYTEIDGKEVAQVAAFGKKTTVEQLPLTGVQFYSSNDHNNTTEHVVGSLLTKDGKIVSDAWDSGAVVDFDQRKVAGISRRSEGGNHQPDQDPNYTQAGTQPDHYEHDGVEIVDSFFVGSLGSDGTIHSVKTFHNLGFQQSHAEFTGDLNGGTPTFGMSLAPRHNLMGSGQLYGSNAQGIAITASGAGGEFFAAGYAEQEEDHQISAQSGHYIGYGRGIRASGTDFTTIEQSHIGSLSLSVDFTSRTVMGGMNLDGVVEAQIGSDQIVYDQEVFAASLSLYGTHTGGTSTHAGETSNSFLIAADLPDVIVGQDSSGLPTFDPPKDVMWGTWNVVEDNGIDQPVIRPGHHNFWVAGIATQVDSTQTTEWEKIGLTGSKTVYRGEIMGTLVSPMGPNDYQGWEKIELSSTTQDPNFTVIDTSGSTFVESHRTSISIAVDMTNQSMRSLAVLPNGQVMVGSRDINSAYSGGITGSFNLFSLGGNNLSPNRLFGTAGQSSSNVMGMFAGTNGDALIMEFARDDSAGTGALYTGVGVTGKQFSTDSNHAGTFIGRAHGVSMNATDPNAIPMLMDSRQQLVLKNDATKFEFAGYLQNLDSGGIANIAQDDWNTFIDKNAFFGTVTNNDIEFHSAHGIQSLDPDNSFVLGMPGLEGFDYITWGIWGARSADGSTVNYGHFGIGTNPVDGSNNQLVPDFSVLANSANPIMEYRGMSMGTLWTGNQAEMLHGAASVTVDFSTGDVTGVLNLGHQATVNLNGGINAATASFEGNATLNGGGSGGFAGGFYGDEMAGSFGATNGTQTVSGAFGAEAQGTIPLTPATPPSP